MLGTVRWRLLRKPDGALRCDGCPDDDNEAVIERVNNSLTSVLCPLCATNLFQEDRARGLRPLLADNVMEVVEKVLDPVAVAHA